jgi:hypothetical protein
MFVNDWGESKLVLLDNVSCITYFKTRRGGMIRWDVERPRIFIGLNFLDHHPCPYPLCVTANISSFTSEPTPAFTVKRNQQRRETNKEEKPTKKRNQQRKASRERGRALAFHQIS